MKKIKLLLVDDQELIRESLAFIINIDEDIEVVGLAENGQRAIDAHTSKEISNEGMKY